MWSIRGRRPRSFRSTYLFCVLKGLNKAPQVLLSPSGVYDPSVITAEDVSALVIPDGCVGLPTLAAVEQGIPVVAVRSNTNLMRNDLKSLPFRAGQLHYASNYYEAAGILSAMKAGVAPATIARPMQPIRVEHVSADRRNEWSRQRPCQWSHERPRERQDPSHEDDRSGHDQRFGNLGGGER